MSVHVAIYKPQSAISNVHVTDGAMSARNANVVVPAFQGSTWKGKEVERIFDTPAYLMPPLGTLFDPLMDEFLTLRTDADAVSNPGQDQYAEQQDVDVDMEGVDGPILVGNRLERVVDHHEMAAMIELFKHHGLHCEYISDLHLSASG